MAYPLTCRAGYPLPIKPGKFTIKKIIAAVNDRTANSRLILIDDHTVKAPESQGKVRSAKTYPEHTQIIDMKGVGGQGMGYLDSGELNLKLRDGLTVVDTTNLQAGGIAVYVE